MKKPIPSRGAPFWGRMSSLWLLLAPLCAVLYTLTTTVSPHDFWWHAAAGRTIAQTGHIPTLDEFSWPMGGEGYVYQNWLAEWLIYRVLQWGGLAWIVLWRSASVGLAFAVIGWAALRRARRVVPGVQHEATAARGVAIGLFLALGMIAMNLDARPQTFALPFFAALVGLLFELPFQGVRLSWGIVVTTIIVPLTVLWANFHGSFFLVPLVILVILCSEEFYARLAGVGDKTGKLRQIFGAPLPPKARGLLCALLILSLAAIMVNPLGFGIFSYVAKLSSNSTIQKYMYEWQPPSFGDAGSLVFFVSPILLLLVARIAWQKKGSDFDGSDEGTSEKPPALGVLGIRPGELLLLLALFMMGRRNLRSILWYALLFAPIFASCAAVAFAGAQKTASDNESAIETAPDAPRAAQLVNAALMLLLVLCVIPVLPQFKLLLGWSPAFRARFAPTPRGAFPLGFDGDPEMLLDKETPVAAAEYLRHDSPQGLLWNDMGFGSYLMWALPGVKVNADPRIELYPAEYWRDYLKLSEGPPDAAQQLEKMGVSDALLDPEAERGLIRRLRAARGWHEIVITKGEAVLMRRSIE